MVCMVPKRALLSFNPVFSSKAEAIQVFAASMVQFDISVSQLGGGGFWRVRFEHPYPLPPNTFVDQPPIPLSYYFI